jgi:hypothetical protein
MPKKVVIEEITIDGVPTLVKECTKCKKKKPLETGFSNSKSTSYGKYPSCKECRKEYFQSSETVKKYRQQNRQKLTEKSRKYREENKEYVKQYNAQYKKSHKEEISEYNRMYYLQNTEKLLANSRKRWADYYYNKHKSQIIVNNQKRRAALKALPNTLTKYDVELILSRFNYKCPLTGSSDIQLDHFIALSTGFGGTIIENIVPLSASLNKSKRDKNPFEWIKSRNDIEIEKFNNVVDYLSKLNKMTVEEYKKFVFDCYENRQTASS